MSVRRAVRFACLALAIAILSGCGLYSAAPGAVAPLAAAEGLTVIGTDKTIGDHIVSYQRGKNCSTIRVQTGRTYCEEDERVGLEEIYCYRTLGQINCYQKPMPYGDKYQAVGHTPPVPPKP